MPQKVCLVFTKETWGCLEGQEFVADVTDDLTAADRKPVLFTEVKNPEDVDNRLELYLTRTKIQSGTVCVNRNAAIFYSFQGGFDAVLEKVL